MLVTDATTLDAIVSALRASDLDAPDRSNARVVEDVPSLACRIDDQVVEDCA